ncbi:MAG: VanZ family protein [Klenkia sp.]|nr:VanZ family protein [Klenkia sp.]
MTHRTGGDGGGVTAPTLVRPVPAPRVTDPGRLVPGVALVGAVLLVVLATLTPAGPGGGWSWGAPAVELRWYLAGLDDVATLTQLLGNLALLVPPAVLAVLRWPALRRPGRLVVTVSTVACSIEALQWWLPLDRVVSPLDALLNTTGAVLAGLVAAAWTRRRVVRGRVAS